MSSDGPGFESRWRIRGRITTASPLVIGSGATVHRGELVEARPEGPPRPIDINAVVTDGRGRAYVPGTTIKGCLRAWLSSHDVAPRDIERVFGSEDPRKRDAVGGRAEFWDALALDDVQLPADPIPYWCGERLTSVASAVAIDRGRRTAAAEKLVHFEFVPPGVSFDVSITGQDLLPADVAMLLAALEAVRPDAPEPVTFGAETVNGFGRCAWVASPTSRITSDPDQIWTWLAGGHVGYDGLPEIPDDVATEIDRARAAILAERPPRSVIEVGLRLKFQGPFLVNDPARTTKKKDAEDDTGEPDHAPLLDGTGGPLLPARSLRGALRSQAERILRTIHPDRRVACRPTSTREACTAISRREDAGDLCLACQLFGAPGWAAPVEVSAFTCVAGSSPTPLRQEFVAIDRFTGGGAYGLKFNAASFYRPVLEGRLVLDTDRLEPWGLGLLALSLRDLVEGDVALGFGRSKGYGAVHAEITSFAARGVAGVPWLAGLLGECGFSPSEEDTVALDPLAAPLAAVEPVLVRLVSRLHGKIDETRQREARGVPA